MIMLHICVNTFTKQGGITGLSMGNIQNVLNGLKHISNIDKVPVTVPSNVNAEAIENIS